MRGLIFIVADRCVIDVGQLVEGQLAVEAKAVVTLFDVIALVAELRELTHDFVTRLGLGSVEQAPRAPAGDELQTGVDNAQPAPVLEARVKITDTAQLPRDPTRLNQLFVTRQLSG